MNGSKYESDKRTPSPPGVAPPQRAELLLRALATEGRLREHTPKELATAIGIHPAHWYRLRAHPKLLARCSRETLESIARYLDWPLGRVLVASATINTVDFEVVMGGSDVVDSAIMQIEGSVYGTGLRSPLRAAARDHQLLIAELYFALQAATARDSRQQES